MQQMTLPEISEENKRNSKAIWQGINNIIYSKKSNKINTTSFFAFRKKYITDSEDISEHFNNFFTSMGQEFQKSIKKPFSN